MDNTDYAGAAYMLNNILGRLGSSHGVHSVAAIVCGRDRGVGYLATQLYARHKEVLSELGGSKLLGYLPKMIVLTEQDTLAEDISKAITMMGGSDFLCLLPPGDGHCWEDSLRYISGVRPEYKYLRATSAVGSYVHVLTRDASVGTYLASGGCDTLSLAGVRDLFKVKASRSLTPSSSCDRPIRGWLHVACMHGGDLIAAEMHGRLKQSGLLHKSTRVEVSLVGDEGCRRRLRSNIFDVDSRYRVGVDHSDLSLYEWPSLIEMWREARSQDFYAYYVHTKGASNCRPDVPQYIQGNLRNWRDCMSHFVIGEHETALSALAGGYDASGALYYPCVNPGIGGMFGGNFWWTTSEHLRRLPDPRGLAGSSGEARMRAESWLCSLDDGRYFNQYWMESGDPYDFPGVYKTSGGPLANGVYL